MFFCLQSLMFQNTFDNSPSYFSEIFIIPYYIVSYFTVSENGFLFLSEVSSAEYLIVNIHKGSRD
jgi:hypothetical protein